MTTSKPTKKEVDTFVTRFIAEKQKLADAAGVPLLIYMAEEHDGLLRDVVVKLLRHAMAHPGTCPSDCALNALLEGR